MEASINSLSKQGQVLADKAKDKMEELRSEAAPLIKKAADQAQSMGKQGMAIVSDMAGQARDVAADASDSIVRYTKKNPVKALAIAAASGALLYAVIKAMTPRRD